MCRYDVGPSDQGLLVARHFPASRDTMPVFSVQDPRARADGPERLLASRRFHAVVDEGTVCAERQDLVVAEGVRLPGGKVGALQHFADRGRRDGSQQKVARKYHDRVGGKQRKKFFARLAKGSPRTVLESADCGGDGGIGQSRGGHCEAGGEHEDFQLLVLVFFVICWTLQNLRSVGETSHTRHKERRTLRRRSDVNPTLLDTLRLMHGTEYVARSCMHSPFTSDHRHKLFSLAKKKFQETASVGGDCSDVAQAYCVSVVVCSRVNAQYPPSPEVCRCSPKRCSPWP